jgi:predicted dehydrogenase
VLEDSGIEAVYIRLPHPFHAQWTIRAAQAGKHVLCDKPIAMNAAEATAVFEAGHAAGRLILEGLMYRAQKQTEKLVELIQSDRIGMPRFIFSSSVIAGRSIHPAATSRMNVVAERLWMSGAIQFRLRD